MAEIISIIISYILLYTWNTYYSKNNSIYGKEHNKQILVKW